MGGRVCGCVHACEWCIRSYVHTHVCLSLCVFMHSESFEQ